MPSMLGIVAGGVLGPLTIDYLVIAGGGGGGNDTYGGGGGGGNRAYIGSGGTGGTGIVILRYPDTLTGNIGSGLTGTESAASGGYKRLSLTAGTGSVWFT